MTADNPRIRRLYRRACLLGVSALLALAGCRSSDGSKGSGGGRDPLVYGPNRIPPQNVPLHDRDGVGAKGTKADPLLERPVGKNGERSGVGYTDNPGRFKKTYIPGPDSTPAALAAKTRDGDELKIDTPDNRVPLQPASGVIPIESDGGLAVDGILRELEKYGVKREDRSLAREDGRYVFRASVSNANGTKRQYTGAADTANDAVKQVLEQITLDRR
jgi:hypothetical protein